VLLQRVIAILSWFVLPVENGLGKCVKPPETITD